LKRIITTNIIVNNIDIKKLRNMCVSTKGIVKKVHYLASLAVG